MRIGGVDTEDVKKAMASFDSEEAFYDPLHDFIEADTKTDQETLKRMENLISDLQTLFFDSIEGRKIVSSLVDQFWSGHSMEQQLSILFALNDEKLATEHVLLADATAKCKKELADKAKWIVYNKRSYFLCVQDIHILDTRHAADVYLRKGNDKFTTYDVIQAASVKEFLDKLSTQSTEIDLSSGKQKKLNSSIESYDQQKDNEQRKMNTTSKIQSKSSVNRNRRIRQRW